MLAFYEQEYGNVTMSSLATEQDLLDNLALSRRLIEEKWPDGIWTVEPYLVEAPPLKDDCRYRPRGWYGVFAPMGVIEIPETADA